MKLARLGLRFLVREMDAAATPELQALLGGENTQCPHRLGLFGLVLDRLLRAPEYAVHIIPTTRHSPGPGSLEQTPRWDS